MPTEKLLSGETIEYPKPAPDVALFLDRLRAAAADPTVDIRTFDALLYGGENPILDRDFLPGKYYITRKVVENPVWHVMSDLQGVKQIQLGLLDWDKVEAAYAISVADAAKQLGITPAAVRAAIKARRLGAHLRNGKWFTRAESIASYKWLISRNRMKTRRQEARE